MLSCTLFSPPEQTFCTLLHKALEWILFPLLNVLPTLSLRATRRRIPGPLLTPRGSRFTVSIRCRLGQQLLAPTHTFSSVAFSGSPQTLTPSLLVSLVCISYRLSTPLALALVFLSSPLRTSSLRSLGVYSHKHRHMPLLPMALS
ncbi:hypothetical protein QCA50_010885 [Cerrena zonata]|uniref:Uncharacterized protein n=1 Tax=Cerrena zonata TaxID=2478898 RepID=A0AAW0G7T9_9APHY